MSAGILDRWDEYHRTMSRIAAEMIGAARHFDKNPDYATDENVARVFRKYAERMAAVEVPARSAADETMGA